MIFKTSKVSNISNNIKKYRKKNHLTQAQMAEMINMHHQNYSQLERGVYSPSLDRLLEICSILNITPNDLLLENREYDDCKKEILESFDNQTLDMLETMKITEELRAEASLASSTGNYEKEKDILIQVIQLFGKNDKYNSLYWKISDFLYHDYINNHIQNYSEETRKKLFEKKFSDYVKENSSQ